MSFFYRASESLEDPICILWLITRRKINTFAGIMKALGIQRWDDSYASRLQFSLQDLRRAGLIEFDNIEGPYRSTAILNRVLHLFGVSLSKLSRFVKGSPLTVRPLLPGPRDDHNLDVFVLMPFRDGLAPIFRALKAVAQRHSLTIRRADSLAKPGSVVEHVWEEINNAEIVVADLTGANANVFYELGLAHAVGKPTILLSRSKLSGVFDVASLRQIRYQLSRSGLVKFKSEISEIFQAVYEAKMLRAGIPRDKPRQRQVIDAWVVLPESHALRNCATTRDDAFSDRIKAIKRRFVQALPHRQKGVYRVRIAKGERGI